MRLVLPGRAVSMAGDSLALVVLSLEVARHGGPALMTLLYAAFALPLLALAPVAGRVVDEFDSRLVLVVGGALQVAASAGLAFAPNVAAMLGCVVVLQAGQSVTGPGWQALVPRIVGEALVGKAIGLQQSLAAVAGLAGAALGGVLYDAVGYRSAMFLDTLTFAGLVVVALLVSTRRGRRREAAGQAGSPRPQPAATGGGWSIIRADQLLRSLVPALWLFVVTAEATNVVEVFLLRDALGASASMYGMVMAGYMLGCIAGPALAGRVDGDRSRVGWTAIAAAAIGALVIAIGLSQSVLLVLVLFALVGVAGGALNALLLTVVITRARDDNRGRVLATMAGASRGFSVLAMVLGGAVGQLLGPRLTFVGCGALSMVVALIVARARNAAGPAASSPRAVPETIDA